MGHIPAGVGAPTGVRVRLLGQPSVVAAGGEHPLGPDRRHQLLGYLAYRGDWVERSRLSALLWGELPEDAASRNLRQALQRVRKLPWVHGLEEEGRRLRWLVPTDLAAVRSALAAGADPDAPLGQLLDGLEGYESGPFADWLTFEREELWRELRGRLLALAAEASGRGDHPRATRLLDGVLACDPFDDDALVARLAAPRRRRASGRVEPAGTPSRAPACGRTRAHPGGGRGAGAADAGGAGGRRGVDRRPGERARRDGVAPTETAPATPRSRSAGTWPSPWPRRPARGPRAARW